MISNGALLTEATNYKHIKITTMKSKKILLAGLVTAAIVTGGIMYAADHIDAPAVTNQTTDITDLYVFRAADPNNLVFVANTQGLKTPAQTAALKFDANTMIEFNIDTNGDAVEDLVMQGVYDAATNVVNIYGPVAPSEKGTRSKVEGGVTASVAVTPYGASTVTTSTSTNGIKVFAGPRDDPFFFDLNAYKAILAGTATSFNNPGTDAFAGTNVMSLVVEVPKTLLGTVTGGKVNVWLETKKKI
ncbi:hypothetical protein BH11BAC4_BH11BAC4_26430 [soil metagenome]